MLVQRLLNESNLVRGEDVVFHWEATKNWRIDIALSFSPSLNVFVLFYVFDEGCFSFPLVVL